jgi:hypothetical protein
MRIVQVLLVALAGLAGCSNLHTKPMTYTNVGDMRPGPGLFTGREGAFVLFHSDRAPSLLGGQDSEPYPAVSEPTPQD